jgi:tetratricopeptide (TPR) repeat protein
MPRNFCLIFVASLVLAGCDLTDKQDAQYDDARNPYYKQAQQDLDSNNPTKAAEDYEAALGANPKLAGAHYQLGHIYGDKLNDPVGEIFHFQQYAKLAPNGDKIDEVKALIDKQSQAFAASLPNTPAQSADDYVKLQADNATLKKQVEDATHTITQLQTQLAKHHGGVSAPGHDEIKPAVAVTPVIPVTPTVTAAVTDSSPGAVPAVPLNGTNAVPLRALPLDSTNGVAGEVATTDASSGPARSYKVVQGDSIWKIAHKMYPGDTKNGMEKIQEANKDVLGTKPLKIGQVLVIP